MSSGSCKRAISSPLGKVGVVYRACRSAVTSRYFQEGGYQREPSLPRFQNVSRFLPKLDPSRAENGKLNSFRGHTKTSANEHEPENNKKKADSDRGPKHHDRHVKRICVRFRSRACASRAHVFVRVTFAAQRRARTSCLLQSEGEVVPVELVWHEFQLRRRVVAFRASVNPSVGAPVQRDGRPNSP